MKNTSLTPQEALKTLQDGNRRFIEGNRSISSLMSQTRMKELAEKGQSPFAIVLTCSDSRSPVELVFDQGIGDLFVVRVAGNVVAPSLLGSIEFAAANFGSPLIVVLGHTQCGAVHATLEQVKNPSRPLPSPHLEELVSRIRPAVEMFPAEQRQGREGMDRCTIENIRRSSRLIVNQSSIVRDLLAKKSLEIHGAILDISSGRVTFLDPSE